MGSCSSQVAADATSSKQADIPTQRKSSAKERERSINVKGHIGLGDPSKVDMELVGKTLNNVLHDPICIEYFAIHLANEHSSENLDFYESVDHYHHEWDINHQHACTNIARKIYQLYCGSNAPLAVNLPSKIRLKVEQRIEAKEITREVFDEAANEIYQVMNRDSFARFKMSPLWASYISHPDRHPDGAPPPAKTRLADCYTGRRNSASLMTLVGTQILEDVLKNSQGFQSFKKFLEVDSEVTGKSALDLYMSIKAFREFVTGLGIPRQEDMFEIEDQVKFLVEKHFKGEEANDGEHPLPSEVMSELADVETVVDNSEHTVRQMCTCFDKMEKASLKYLRDDSFQRFINSALYIKYRMAIVKQESMK
ncbi:hypothetical protein TrVE_jg7782 [Triparma verrucosa]|uniref:RGS domain-containing protein n=2 Tax=Triparma TaxID=722752 RepID=A0A9W7ENE7_9STRA|nr:hypothetical protein TrST_g13061 [Triparma strigata]GMH93042.1 hypothetical protein TrVE_jg7782 [Triparma verrucosa]